MFSRKLFFFVFLSTAYCLLPICLFSQGTWTPKAPFPGQGRFTAVAFTIGTNGYFGTGADVVGNFSDNFWKYDPLANSWTQMANLGGGGRSYATGFSIGNYGYIGTGIGANFFIYYNDFWKYDPIANIWTQVANVGGPPRGAAFGFSIGSKGYIGTGYDSGGLLQDDLWEYEPVNNTWAPKANYLGGNRCDIDRAVFVICDKAYLGTGYESIFGGGSFKNDFWEYDPIVNSWTQKANFPGTPRYGATGFSIADRGFLGLGEGNTGIISDFWKYNPSANSWSAVTSFPGGARVDQPAFVINNKAYVGTGFGAALYNDLWEYTPDSVICECSIAASIASSSNAVCSGQSVTLSASGGSNYSWSNGSANNIIIVSPTVTTAYSVIASDLCGSDTAAVTISVVNVVTAAIACQNVCAGSNATLIASGGTSYLWSNGAVTSAVAVSPATTTNYSVIVSNAGCSDTADCTVNVFPVPVVSTSSNVTIMQGQSATLSSVGGGTYSWSNGTTDSIITVSPVSTTEYCVTVSDTNGCASIACVKVTVEDPCSVAGELYMPNAFSPNGDGENDLLQIYYGDFICIKSFRIVIFGRWGEKIFASTDINTLWDGRYKGKPMNTGVFVYYLEATFISGETITIKGNVSLIH